MFTRYLAIMMLMFVGALSAQDLPTVDLEDNQARTLKNEERSIETEEKTDVAQKQQQIRSEKKEYMALKKNGKLNLNKTAAMVEKKAFGSNFIFIDARIPQYIFARDWTGLFVELSDRSIWNVDPFDDYIVRGWHPSDRIYLTPYESLFSSYQFKMINIEDGTSALVNLNTYPAFIRTIAHIDRYARSILLSDGTIWNVDTWDDSRLAYWYVNDTVIFGVNNWDSFFYPYVLINLNVNTPQGKSLVHANIMN